MKTNYQFFRKLLVTMCALCLSVASILMLSACGTIYHSQAGTLQDIAGTYQLTTYIQKDENGNEVDRIKQLKVKAYLVVGKDGHGYYAYQDDNTPFWYDTTLIEYTQEYDNDELFKAIQFSTGKRVIISQQKPGCGYEPTMGFNVNTKTFNYYIPDYKPSKSWIYPSYYTDVVYTKISDKTDLSTIASQMNRTLAALPKYELKNLNGALIFNTNTNGNSPEANRYKYYVVDFNAVNETADIYYELTTGSDGAQVQNNVDVDVKVTSTTDEYGYISRTLSVKLLNQYYTAPISFSYNVPNYLNYTVWTEPDENGTKTEIYNNSFQAYFGDKTDIADIVAEQLTIYNNNH